MKLRRWRERWHVRRADAWPLLCVALFFVAFFPQVIFGDRFVLTGDAFYATYPMRTVAWDMIRAGRPPIWTPYVLGGYPLLSMAQVAVGYPLTWTYLVLPGVWAEQLYVLAPFLLSPAFTYAYARELGRSRLAALLAGLAFGYGGMMCGFISNSGILTNSLAWSPLLLLFIDRARSRPLAHCLPRAAVVYALSVLAGHPQSYAYIAALAACYGLFLSLWRARARGAWARWRPLVVALGAMLLAAGVAAFQLLESLRAARRSIRSELSYERFSEGSFAPREALLSVGAQLYHYVDTGTYVAPLALLMALCAVVASLRARVRADARVWFWLAVAVVSFLLLLGSNTPLNRLAYHVPVIRQFRVPSRHTFEWTLAVSILAAYGWDAVAAWFARRREGVTIKGSARGGTTREKAAGERTTDERTTGESATGASVIGERATAASVTGESAVRARGINLVVALALLAAGLFVGAMWWRATSRPPVPNPSIYTGLPESSYWLWKLAFTAVVFALACCSFRLRAARPRAALLGSTIMLACFFEPAATISCWWGRQLSLPAARVRAVSPTTRYLRGFPPEQNRVYTRAGLFAEEFNASPRLESPNLHAVYGLQNLAGMEPVVLERFSLALGGVGPDSVTPREGFPPNEYIFGARSRVLDLLNTTHVVTYAGLNTSEAALTYKDGVGLSTADLRTHLAPGESARLAAAAADADQLVLVTSLSNSGEETQGSAVALARVFTTDGGSIELPIRAGVDTAEWAHERADVRPAIRHALAPVFDGRPGDAANSFTAYRYWSRLPLGGPRRVARVEIENVSRAAWLSVTYATLYDSRSGRSAPLSRGALSEYWTTVYDKDQVQILRNARACPRAWLVGEAEAVDGAEALRRVRGDEGAREFDPSRTALLEVRPGELPKLPGGGVVAGGGARIVAYEPARLVVETDAPAASVLVVSEMFYPGWEAAVDGSSAPILLTDYLLRGVALPAGRHTVEMRYTAPAARSGALVSALTLLLLCALFAYGRLGRKRRTGATAL